MLVAIDTNDPRPVFRQIVDEIQRCVAVGVLRAGDPLAAVRTLAADLQINANTVQHAYRTLEQEGTVEVRRGLGTFISNAPLKDVRGRPQTVARQIAERMLREGYRHGLLASDLMAALKEIAPVPGELRSGAGGQEDVKGR
jgi:GntR family transcriptional regulator